MQFGAAGGFDMLYIGLTMPLHWILANFALFKRPLCEALRLFVSFPIVALIPYVVLT